jgi:hypothetical protein
MEAAPAFPVSDPFAHDTLAATEHNAYVSAPHNSDRKLLNHRFYGTALAHVNSMTRRPRCEALGLAGDESAPRTGWHLLPNRCSPPERGSHPATTQIGSRTRSSLDAANPTTCLLPTSRPSLPSYSPPMPSAFLAAIPYSRVCARLRYGKRRRVITVLNCTLTARAPGVKVYRSQSLRRVATPICVSAHTQLVLLTGLIPNPGSAFRREGSPENAARGHLRKRPLPKAGPIADPRHTDRLAGLGESMVDRRVEGDLLLSPSGGGGHWARSTLV